MGQDAASTVIQPLKKRNIFVDVLAILFGISSWLGVTSTFVQLPLLVLDAPEQWQLASHITITIQSANIGSLIYVLYQKYSPKKIDDGYLIYCTLFIGCVAAICMAFFYKQTVEIGGEQHSVALLVFTLLFALVGCLSSVLFMPYMGRFRECYLVSYMLGMGLNGFLSSVMALIQGVGKTECVETLVNGTMTLVPSTPPPLFETKLFFIFVFMIMVMSTVAFVLLNNLKVCKKEYAAGTIGMGNEYHYDRNENSVDTNQQNIPDDVHNLSTFNYISLMVAVVGLSGLGNGILPSLIPYFSMPYGNVTYHLSATLANIAVPCAGFIAMFIPHISIRVIRILSLIGAILAVYILYIATQSPAPPLKDLFIGKVLVVSSLQLELQKSNFFYRYNNPY